MGTRIIDEEPCNSCYYRRGNHIQTCDYILMVGKHRPSPPGVGCTAYVKRTRRRRKNKEEQNNA